MKKGYGIAIGAISGLLGLVLLLLVVVQIVLSPSVCAKLLDKYAPLFIDGKVTASKAYVSVLRNFPSVTANLDDLVVTYPADRFDSSEVKGVQGYLVHAGTFRPVGFRRGAFPAAADSLLFGDSTAAERMDTLLALRKLSAKVSLLPLLRGVVKVRGVELERPRAFLHFYSDSTSNLDIIRLGSAGDTTLTEDSAAPSSLPEILVRKLSVTDNARIVYTDQKDTLMAMLLMKNLDIKGRVSTDDLVGSSVKLDLDSLLVAGRLKKDTLLFDLNSFDVMDRKGDIKLRADAKAYLATHTFGRIGVPLGLDGRVKVTLNDGYYSFSLRDFDMDVATVHFDTDMDVTLADSIALKGYVAVPGLDVQQFLDRYAANFYKDAAKLHTDASLAARVEVDGWLDTSNGHLPAFTANVSLPECSVSHSDYPIVPKLALELGASAPQGGPVDAKVDRLMLRAPGLRADVKGSGADVLGKAAAVQADAKLDACLDTLGHFLGSVFGMDAVGTLSADLKAKIKLHSLNLYNLSGADITARMDASGIAVASYDDSLHMYADSMNLKVALMENRFGRGGKRRPVSSGKSAGAGKTSGAGSGVKKEVKLLGATLNVDSLYFKYKDNIQVNGRNVKLFAQTSPDKVQVTEKQAYNPILSTVDIGSLFFEGADSLSVRLKNSRNTLSIRPQKGDMKVPLVHVSSNNARVRAKMGPHRVFLSSLGLDANAVMQGQKRKEKLKAYMDSVYRSHPEWSRDSVKSHLRYRAMKGQAPSWIRKDDFLDKDIKLDLGESFRKYFTQWDLNGNLSLGMAGVATPVYPLRTAVRGFHGSFNNDRVSLDSLALVSGSSRIAMKGALTNLRSALLNHGIVRLNAEVQTDSLALIELLNAYAQGQKNMSADLSALEGLDDSAYEAAVATAAASADEVADTTYSLIVVPANVDANLKLRGKGVNYAKLDMSRFDADLAMKDRCLQISGLSAESQMGNVGMDAFYSTKSKRNVQAGFDLTLDKIRAAQVIELIPQLDTLMPLLKSFDGLLNCNIAATTKIDTNMNILTNTLDGIIRITGKDLHFHDNKQLAKIGRLLLFKHPERATVDTMTVEGVIKDNKLEIFPFVLNMDRWSVAMAGVQSLDESFNYHFSITRTPLLLKLGANVYGTDFDHMKFKLGKPKFKNRNVPSFSEVIDTTRVNLVSSIKHVFDKGVERAVREYRLQESLKRAREAANYKQSVAYEEMEELSPFERKQLDSLDTQGQETPDTLKASL